MRPRQPSLKTDPFERQTADILEDEQPENQVDGGGAGDALPHVRREHSERDGQARLVHAGRERAAGGTGKRATTIFPDPEDSLSEKNRCRALAPECAI
jgi:hypothetical protein